MQRAVLKPKDRTRFFSDLFQNNKIDINKLASRYRISSRTLRDWRRGKFLPSLETLKTIAKDFQIKLPPFEVVPQYWYITSENARRAALVRLKLYGPPGTPDGRRKGGLTSQQKRRENPEYYRRLGCKVAKKFTPLKKTKHLSELFGILLGDGGITQNQVKITLHKTDDRAYSRFVKKLITQEFEEKPSLYERENVLIYMLSGRNLVKNLESFGLKKGNKIKNQVDIPKWILKNKKFALT